MKKQKSISQINKEIAREQASINKEMEAEKKRKNLAVAKKKLFEMKHRKAIGVLKIIGKGGKKVYKIAQESEKRQARSSSGSKRRVKIARKPAKRKIMSERKFYGSAEHFNTEMSYDEYKKRKRRVSKPKRRVKKRVASKRTSNTPDYSAGNLANIFRAY